MSKGQRRRPNPEGLGLVDGHADRPKVLIGERVVVRLRMFGAAVFHGRHESKHVERLQGLGVDLSGTLTGSANANASGTFRTRH
ncbi:MAG: hypothetical protein AAB597_02350 [Patescibacteria group bacterium]